MATQSCLNNIQKKTPPTYCGDTLCGSIQGDINEYCDHLGLGGDVPVPQAGPNGKCWCCCSCMAWGTPIEVSAGNYRMIETILTGMKVIATGGNLGSWEAREVTGIGGIAPGTPLDFCYTGYFTLADGTKRVLTSTADHLYLVPGGKLQPIQDLRPGNVVVQADGKEAKVDAVVIGQWSGGVRNFALGEFEPDKHPEDPYKGHLVNTFGIVTADLAVQTAFYRNAFSDDLLAGKCEEIPHIGSAGFFEKYDTTFYDKVVRTPDMWPAGFTASAPPLINVPPSALAYFTPEQAEDLKNAEPNQNLGNSDAIAQFKYLRSLFRGLYPNLYYVADWTQDTPNAWFFNGTDQPYAVLSGGLIRLGTLTIPGLSMIISHLIAQSQGRGCTGEADYWGTAVILRELWYDELYFEMFEQGKAQIAATFALISPEHSGENPDNICAQPSLACREEAIANAGRFAGLPACAKPPAAFAVTGAEAPSLEEVVVTFSAKVFGPTAGDPANYSITDDVKVLQVAVREDMASVKLIVSAMRPSTSHTVTVTNVISDRGQRLSKDASSAKFTTP
jgi:hypothetical protein